MSQQFQVAPEHAGKRLDHFLVAHLADISRARVQDLITQDKVLVDGKPAKPSLRLRGGETIAVLAPAPRPPLRATAEEIPLDIAYEDDDLAVVNKPAGMMVHAGAGSTADARNRGTLVNALLHRFGALSGGRRRIAPRNRASPRPQHQRVDRRRQERPRPPQTGRAVCPPAGAQDLHRARPRLGEAGPRHDSVRHQPRPPAPHPHDHAARRRPRGRVALPGFAAHRLASRQIHPAGGKDRNRAHPPDPRAPVLARTSRGRRHALRRAARDPAAGENQTGAARVISSEKLFACCCHRT